MDDTYWLSDQAWAAIEPLLPKNRPGPQRVDDRRVISGILHVLKTGCRWTECPAVYGPRTTICARYNRWTVQGVWRKLFERLTAAGGVPEELTVALLAANANRRARGPERSGQRSRRPMGRDAAAAA
jgi:transposase